MAEEGTAAPEAWRKREVAWIKRGEENRPGSLKVVESDTGMQKGGAVSQGGRSALSSI